ncbi:DUF2330 domain-containing protein [Homoserinibacter sp. GY 40078]|uniref:DUF2330 domain-containing protein n=1 Tax=Homoserinibacter sp. GY 40078 TaxID=2603275 RepID=UPI0011C95CDD|nr:DUF2330 domain-containing protein [Homoserinibacter sp. GY 40078]TXK17304.1 DUF2330 domain-containing protein [Homoserinibacter sp. GY 40078]
MTRRVLAGSTAVALLAVALTAGGLAQPASACACGAPAPPAGTVVSVGEEHALISHDGTTERIEMVLDMLADGAETGLIVPTPNPAKVSVGSASLFEAIDELTARDVEVVEDWWGATGDGGGGAAPEVLSEVDLGPITAVTLAASDAEGLDAWLTENGYGIDASVSDLFADYIDRGWSFAAFKLTGEDPLDGALDPIRLDFRSRHIVYPLLLSQAATTPQTVRLYLFGEDRMQAAFPDETAVGSVVWAGPVTDSTLEPLGAYLTEIEAYFPDPASQITGDLTITSTGVREDYTSTEIRTKYVQIAGLPVGVAIVGVASVFGFMLLIVVIGGIIHRRAEKRRRRVW